MADNVTTQTSTLASVPTALKFATDEIASLSGDSNVHAPISSIGVVGGSEGSKTLTPVTDSAGFPVKVVGTNTSVKQDDAAFTPGTDYVAVIGAQADETAPDSVNEGDAGALRMTLDRLLKVTNELESSAMRIGGVSVTPKFAAISSTGSGDTVALVSAKKIRVLSLAIVLAGASTVKFQSGASTDKTGAMSFAANGGISLPFNPAGWFETAAGEKLNHVLGSSVAIAGMLSYIEV